MSTTSPSRGAAIPTSTLLYFYHDFEKTVRVRIGPALEEIRNEIKDKKKSADEDGRSSVVNKVDYDEFLRVPTLVDALKRPSCDVLIWENTPTKEVTRRALPHIRFYNHLSAAAHIFGNKANLALLMGSKMRTLACDGGAEWKRPRAVPSYVFADVKAFSSWCTTSSSTDTGAKREAPQWVAKIPLANSGSGVWVLGDRNRKDVAAAVTAATSSCASSRECKKRSTCVVVQRYVDRPLLWRGRKLQFRVYVLIKGDLSCWICRSGLLQVCNKTYSVDHEEKKQSGVTFDDERHITNVCRNKHNEDLFVEESPCDLPKEYPRVFASMVASITELVRAAKPFLAEQRRPDHFEYLGVDFLADAETRSAWLIECNCPPNNTGSKGVEGFHHRVWTGMLRCVCNTSGEGRGPLHGAFGVWSRYGDALLSRRGPSEGEETEGEVAKRVSRNLLLWCVHRRRALKAQGKPPNFSAL